MKKLLLLSLGVAINAFALDGYWGTSYSNLLKNGYGECVHTSYFDEQVDGVAACGEASSKGVSADNVDAASNNTTSEQTQQ